MQQWEFSVGGKNVVFSADAANEKVFLRANGRLVTRPLAAGDDESLFEFDRAQFRLGRLDGALDLQMVAPPAETVPAVRDAAPSTGSSRTQLAHSERPPASVVVRAKICFYAALLVLIYSAWHVYGMNQSRERIRQIDNMRRALDHRTPDPATYERIEAYLSLVISTFRFEAFLAAAGMIASVFLMKGFRRAPLALAALWWTMFALFTFLLMRSDRIVHAQMNNSFEPADAATAINGLHHGDVIAFAVAALVTGGLLQLIRPQTIDRLFEDKVY